MFVHISPEPEALGETLSTLKFAERVSTVELGAARVTKESSDAKELKEQVLVVFPPFSYFASYLKKMYGLCFCLFLVFLKGFILRLPQLINTSSVCLLSDC